MPEYRSRITYSPEVFEALCKVQNNVYYRRRIRLFQLICIMIMAFAVALEISRPLKILLVAIGGILFSFSNYLPKYKAKSMISACNGNFATITYNFFADRFVMERNDDTLDAEYSDITKIIKTEKYVFLFPNSNRAYAIDTSRIRPREPEALLDFLSDRTGLNPKTIFIEKRKLFI